MKKYNIQLEEIKVINIEVEAETEEDAEELVLNSDYKTFSYEEVNTEYFVSNIFEI